MGAQPYDGEIRYISMRLPLRSGEDDDLIKWFESLPPRGRAKAVKTALRSGGVQVESDGEQVSDDDLDAAFDLMFE